jgi:endonuclease YncB( thermonuclease family)
MEKAFQFSNCSELQFCCAIKVNCIGHLLDGEIAMDGNRVKLNIVETDRYGRSVAEVWNGYGLVQSALAGSGLVYPYEQYKSDCPSWDAVKQAGDYAIANSLGLWGNPSAVKPWDYRRSK